MTPMRKLAVMLLVAAALMSMPGSAAAQTKQSIWDTIQLSGIMKGLVLMDSRPGSWRDVSTGTYHGMVVNIERALIPELSKAMGKPIKLELVESTEPSRVLDLQSGKIDIALGMGATPERLKAIDMAGPLYDVPVCVIPGKGFQAGKMWADYNKPDMRISTPTGGTDEKAVQELAPKATILSFKDFGQIILAVQAGRAHVLAKTAFDCLDIKKRNPEFGSIIFPEPIRGQPSMAGMRKDGDGRFYKFVQAWAEKSRASGLIKKLLLDGLREAGLNPDELPPEITF